jgi:hypothetical protein
MPHHRLSKTFALLFQHRRWSKEKFSEYWIQHMNRLGSSVSTDLYDGSGSTRSLRRQYLQGVLRRRRFGYLYLHIDHMHFSCRPRTCRCHTFERLDPRSIMTTLSAYLLNQHLPGSANRPLRELRL